MTTPGRAEAEALDAGNPLAPFAGTFLPGRPGVIYLAGNSLGRPPRIVARALARTTERWAADLVTGWERWRDLPRRAGDRLARHFLGARPDEVVVADSTTVNLYKLAAAALDAAPGRSVVVTDEGNFPTDRYVLQGLARARGLTLRTIPTHPVEGADLDALARAVDSRTALVCLSHVDFVSGALLDMAAVNDIVHDQGALALWDLSHSVGSVPVDLEGAGADLAVGCTYKYLNAGPGAPAFLYVRAEHAGLRPPIWGWFGQRDQFAMAPAFDPVTGATRFLAGTPNVPGTAAVRHAARHLASVGIGRLRAGSIALTEFALARAAEWLVPLGFEIATPRDPGRRGGHVALAHPDAYRVGLALRAAGVVADVRPPDRIRLAPVPAYTGFADVWEALGRLRRLVADRAYESFDPARRTVS